MNKLLLRASRRCDGVNVVWDDALFLPLHVTPDSDQENY